MTPSILSLFLLVLFTPQSLTLSLFSYNTDAISGPLINLISPSGGGEGEGEGTPAIVLSSGSPLASDVASGRWTSCPHSCSWPDKCCCEGGDLNQCLGAANGATCFDAADFECCGCIHGSCYACDSDQYCHRVGSMYECRYEFDGLGEGGLAGTIVASICCCGFVGFLFFCFCSAQSSRSRMGYQPFYTNGTGNNFVRTTVHHSHPPSYGSTSTPAYQGHSQPAYRPQPSYAAQPAYNVGQQQQPQYSMHQGAAANAGPSPYTGASVSGRNRPRPGATAAYTGGAVRA